jgi:hypothetical protein
MTPKTPTSRTGRRRRVGKLRGGKGGWEPRPQIQDRLARVITLHEQGWTQAAIAVEVGVSQPAVSKILHRADARAAEAIQQEVTTLKMRRMRMLEYVSREGRRAWEQSKQGRGRKRQRKTTSRAGAPTVIHEILVEEHPDPRMLEQARKAEEAIAEVCGLTGSARGVGAGLTEAPAIPELTPEEIAARLNALLEETMAAAHSPDHVADVPASQGGQEGPQS